MDREFGRRAYNAEDDGTFERDLVFVGMSFRDDMNDAYSTLRIACEALSLKVMRVDDNVVGSG